MNILITGANGQLGNEMQLLAKQHSEHQFFMTDIQELDITDRNQVNAFIANNDIQLIVNCAAYTNVDKAEEDEQTALLINATAPHNLALAAANYNCKLIHISTDYVFDGKNFIPYKETDIPSPATAYGRTKLEGERLIKQALPSAIIIRTAWLYSEFGKNFCKTMLQLAETHPQLSVIYDQIGTPTYALDLAQAIFTCINAEQWHPGIYHFTNEGVCSWYDFTCLILQLANKDTTVIPILSQQYPTKTPRPHYSLLDKAKFKNTFNTTIPHWTTSLKICINNLLNN